MEHSRNEDRSQVTNPKAQPAPHDPKQRAGEAAARQGKSGAPSAPPQGAGERAFAPGEDGECH